MIDMSSVYESCNPRSRSKQIFLIASLSHSPTACEQAPLEGSVPAERTEKELARGSGVGVGALLT